MNQSSIHFGALGAMLVGISTDRLVLRPVAISDAWPLFEATRNPHFNKHLMWERPDSEQDVIDRIAAVMDSANSGQTVAVSAVLKTTGEWVALFRFIPHAADPSLVEMGLWVSDRFWKGGYGVELGRACVSAAFELSPVPVLLGAAAEENVGSCKVMEACGLRETGDVEPRVAESGAVVALKHFRITRSDWAVADVVAPFVLHGPVARVRPTGLRPAPPAPAASSHPVTNAAVQDD